ncbi:SNF2 family N-terminal domain-containing protein [Mycena sp. CBHHK59/15]|nr:SNF2 family N-terminal domain-containing protein [Mycena sp. CBHHK59/15]
MSRKAKSSKATSSAFLQENLETKSYSRTFKNNSGLPPQVKSAEPSSNKGDENPQDEEISIPKFANERPLSSEEAAAALRDLFEHGINHDSNVRPDQADAVVPGFREGVLLMPHQILGRAWMRDREDSSKKKGGGILADDMGLGKTIQALTRIVEGVPRKEDVKNGWVKATLVICPLALIEQWDAEIKKMTAGLKVIQYHGPTRSKEAKHFSSADIVITTYGIVCSEHLKPTLLFETRWWRIILDEAHTIKTRTTKTAEACWDLEAKFRWCLTATPMQNKVEDFFSLMRFLRIRPLNDWDRFKLQIAKPIDKGAGAGVAMKRLQVVLKHILLRRTKVQLEQYLALPARTVKIVSCLFDPLELQFYTALRSRVQALLQKILAKGTANYMNVLVLLLRLRQACDHPSLVLDGYEKDFDAISPGSDNAEFKDDSNGPRCKVCTARLTRRNIAARDWPGLCIECAALQVQAENLQSSKPASAKIRMILHLLRTIHQRSGGQEKTIIFSQFTCMLDVIEPFLSAIGVGYVRYDGSMAPKERHSALKEIETDGRKMVLLASLKAGGTGLNLTACNNVILVDMWWNPAVEEQAFDRTHRVGQTRDVHIYKLKINNTVEDRIMQLQARKRELTNAALSGDRIKNMRLGMDELLELFK